MHLRQRLHDFAVDLPEEDEGEDNGGAFCDREGPPDVGDDTGLGEEPGSRNEHDELSSEGDDQRVDALGEGLEDGT